MSRIFMLFGGCLLVVCAAVMGAERKPLSFLSPEAHRELRELEGPAKTVLEARQLGEVLYFFEVPEPMERGPSVEEDGSISFKEARWLKIGGIVSNRASPSRDELEGAAEMYREALSELRKIGEEGKTIAVPYAFIGVQLWILSYADYDPRKFDLEKVWRGYEVRPSDLAALVYLELALTEKKLGRGEECSRLLKEGVAKLKLLEIHYCADTIFREYLHGSLNFARPETCLLFLAGEDARLNGRAAEARKYYTTIIERAPGSPFAWEALAKLEVMGGSNRKQMEWLKSILLHTYPLVWGCPREDLKLDRDGFAAALPALLKKAGEEETKEREPKDKTG